MRIILGIGNPGSRYAGNRHNVGFLLLDYFANKNSLNFYPSKNDYYYSEGKIEEFSYTLIKPSTYVNNSGLAAAQIMRKYELNAHDLLVVYDDLNLNVADCRVKISGGDGGHNGISSIIYHTASDQFPRIRIGIGNDFEKGKMAEYVLSDFKDSEIDILKNTFEYASNLIKGFIKGGLKLMLDTNSKLSKPNTNS